MLHHTRECYTTCGGYPPGTGMSKIATKCRVPYFAAKTSLLAPEPAAAVLGRGRV
ncbi:hypothetical protein HanXRQr2_Chr11g0470361 [Helianthus annuus]|uniref:Uncharacterized protein n=1 Tax=Helianthus annuus TaxID=4232 RepID=A0A9K3HKZ3_HELAN|nr:hypothetical protein HanXRQr2_Chr11g0470361 [Helianthus annuus]